MYLWNMYSSLIDSLIAEIILAITNKMLININLYILQYMYIHFYQLCT